MLSRGDDGLKIILNRITLRPSLETVVQGYPRIPMCLLGYPGEWRPRSYPCQNVVCRQEKLLVKDSHELFLHWAWCVFSTVQVAGLHRGAPPSAFVCPFCLSLRRDSRMSTLGPWVLDKWMESVIGPVWDSRLSGGIT